MTTTSKASDHPEISVNLEHDAELSILTWRIEVQTIAASLATLVTPTGLLTYALTDPEWQAHEANRSTSPNGTVTIAARPTSPTHVPIVGGMSPTAIAVAKYKNEQHHIWHDTKTLLKRLIVDSLGPTLAATFGPPPHGFALKTIRQIVTDVNYKFENVDAVALDALKEALLLPLESVYDLEKHLTRLTRYILISAHAGFPIEDYRQVRMNSAYSVLSQTGYNYEINLSARVIL
jgi:hypothetical protein